MRDDDHEDGGNGEGEDGCEDDFKDFFKSPAGEAIKMMFRYLDRRLDKVERKLGVC